jgi:hypothetical protein
VLLSDSQPLDDAFVAVDFLALQVIEKAPPLADEAQEPPPRVVVLLVGLEVFGQIVDPRTQKRDLDLGRTRVLRVLLELSDQLLPAFWSDPHLSSIFFVNAGV